MATMTPVAERFTVTLETARLRLVPLVADPYAEDLRALYRDPDVVGSFGESPYDDERLDRLVAAYTDTHHEGPYRQYAILEKETGRFTGFVGVRPGADGAGELGYNFAPPFWGRGYATEAAGATLQQALVSDGLPRVVGAASNPQSARVMEKLSMTATGEETEHGPLYAIERAAPVDGWAVAGGSVQRPAATRGTERRATSRTLR
jgi:ribosomal-protein-alanine N-acetyltransferase